MGLSASSYLAAGFATVSLLVRAKGVVMGLGRACSLHNARPGIWTGMRFAEGRARAERVACPLRRAQSRTREERCRRSRVRANARCMDPRAEADMRASEPALSCRHRRRAVP